MLAALLLMYCRVKLKDYTLPGAADPEDLEQYSLKNFDLKSFQLSQQQPDPEPALVPDVPPPNQLYANAWSSVQEQPIEQSFIPAPNPARAEPAPLAPEPFDVHFGQHFTLLQPLYTPFSQPQTWKLPRWVVATVGLFFGSAAVFAIATCVVLLRDPKPAPTEPLAAVPAAPVATPAPVVAATAPAPARQSASAPIAKAPAVHNDAAPARRVVVSRQPSIVRRQFHGPRRVASRSTSPSVALQETETATRRPPQDALDKLLGESSLAGAP